MKNIKQKLIQFWYVYLIIFLVILIILLLISNNHNIMGEISRSGANPQSTSDAITATPSDLPPASIMPSPVFASIPKHNADLPIDKDKFNNIISTAYGGIITDSLAKYLSQNLDILEATNTKITSYKVADVNHDGENELILCYIKPYDKKIEESDYYLQRNKINTSENFIGVYAFKSGSLEEVDKAKITEISDISITNLIPAYKDAIFIKSKYGGEYPFYEMYSMKDNKLFKINLKEFGLNTQAQFVDVGNDTIYIGHRITDGVYGGDDFKWTDGGFISVKHHYADNRILYKTQLNKDWNGDISNISKTDKTIPDVKNGEVTVSNAYQLLSVIGSNRTIYLKPGIYDIGLAPEVINDNVLIDLESNKFEIKNVSGLKIVGMGSDMVEIALRYPNSKVLKFGNSESLEFKNIIVGHGLEFSSCTQEVLNLENCRDVKIDSCAFYGSGAYGITTKNVSNMNVLNSTIEECSCGGVILEDSKNLNFHSTNFYKNSGEILINVRNSSKVVFDGLKQTENTTKIFEKHENSEIDIKN